MFFSNKLTLVDKIVENNSQLKDVWNVTLEKVEAAAGKDLTDLWVRSINPLLLENDILKLEISNSLIYDNLKKLSLDVAISNSLKEVLGREIKLEFSISIKQETRKDYSQAAAQIQEKRQNYQETGLSSSYTFEEILEGDSNRFAITMAKKVAENPGGSSNPYFVYAPSGMGKTHILHAIGNEILRKKPSAKILYASADTFVDEFIQVIKEGKFEYFRSKYRTLDCLLLDDVQFIVKKERSEEEFFHTFNSLFDFKKQIVVSSDKAPNDLELNERLITRFKTGAIADIKRPEYELRVAILNRENEKNNFHLPSDVINFIAEKVTDSVRSLKGCISNVAHFCLNNNIYPSIDTVENLIKDYIPAGESASAYVPIEKIKEEVARAYNLNPGDLNLKTRTERISFARQVAMYLACNLTDKSLPEIGEAFGKDHSTVIYARDKVIQMIQNDPFLNKFINDLVNKIRG